jgi:hypothetical protein
LVVSFLVIAAVAVVTGGVRIALDERRLSSVTPGMKLSEVERVLGRPTEVFYAPLPPVYAPQRCARKEQIASAALYVRGWRDSLFVFVDGESRIVCTERVSISYGVHVLQGDG